GAGRESTREAMLEVFGTESTVATHTFGGKTDWQTLTELLTAHGVDAETVGQQMPVYEAAVARHLTRIIATRTATALPGALDAVAALRQREDVLLGVVTGNVSTTAPIKLRAAGYDPAWFPIGAYGSEAFKRDDLPPIAVRRAVTHKGRQYAPHEVVIIGDTVADIQCARASGARVISVVTGFEPRDVLVAAQPDALIDDLTHLFSVL
ncbi:MAG: haloacid dehalogenase-like hydrolase, partial [Armatimonadetes bacterium]|nr:haloacid dehalogenase-like hydrolase [Anaerolineae bacterium]